ncbi:MAG: class I SAM-dependent methyltransferase [Candidatus Woesearchaeota archaeon]
MKTDRYYDDIAKGYDELYKREQMKKLKLILKNIKIPSGAAVLDVGCGTGYALEFFENSLGLDPSIELLKKSKSRVVCANAENMPFKDKAFDLVFSITAVHHFNLEKAIPEMLRVGRENFVFTVLKRIDNFNKIIETIKTSFDVYKMLEEDKDFILFCKHRVRV